MTYGSSTLFLIPLIAASWVLASIAVLGYNRPYIVGARALAALSAALVMWLFGYLLELLSLELEQKFFWDTLQWAPVFVTGLAALKLSFDFNGIRWRPLRNGLLILPVLFYAALWVGLPVYPPLHLLPNPPFGTLDYAFTLPMTGGVGYTFILISVALVLLARAYWRNTGKERARIGFTFAGLSLGSVLFVALVSFGATVLGQRDVGPFAFSIGGLVMAWGVFRYRLFDLIPVANGLLLEKASDAVIVLDAEDRVAQLNTTAQKWASATVAKPLGQPFGQVFPEWSEAFTAHRGEASTETEIRNSALSANGEALVINLRIEPILDARGRWVGRLVIARDVTPVARLLMRLRQSEQHHRIIVESIRDMVVQVDSGGKVLYVNPSCQSMLGYRPEEVIGRSGFDFIHPDDVMQATKIVRDIIDRHIAYPFARVHCLHADGRTILVEATGSKVVNAGGEVEGLIFVFRDMTVRLELEALYNEQEKLEVALRKEQELSELKNRMMVRIAHEFRTPLTVIQTSVYLLENFADRFTPEQRREKYEGIVEHIRRISNMLNAMADVVYNRFSGHEMHFRPVMLEALCRELVDDVRNSREPKQTLDLSIEASPLILADYTFLYPAIRQILTNAVLYSPDQSVIGLRLFVENGRAVIELNDQGIGIPANDLERIYEPLFRGSNIGERSGLGLGPTIAQASVIAHLGQITVRSVVNKGTTVTLRFPVWAGDLPSGQQPAQGL